MSTKNGFSLSGLINRVLTPFRGKPQQVEEPDFIDCRNPWQANLERLKTNEHNLIQPETPPPTDSLTSFVTDLAKKTLEHEVHKTDQQKLADAAEKTAKQPKRAGDKTINDMKSWWQDSLTPAEGAGSISAELPGKPRLLKRWFE